MNIKRSLILLAILVVIFIGAVIAFYPNWMWFKNLDFRFRILDHDSCQIQPGGGPIWFAYDCPSGRQSLYRPSV